MPETTFILRAGERAATRIARSGVTAADIGCIPAAAGGPKGLALLPLDRLLPREWLTGAADLHLVGASIGAWRMAALASPDVPEAISRLQRAYVHGQRYAHRPRPDDVSSVCRTVVRELLGPGGLRLRDGVALHVVTSRARGALAEATSLTAFARAAFANSVSRDRLGAYFERVVFHGGTPTFMHEPFDTFGLQLRPLTATNAEDALLASGTIPLVASPVRGVESAPAGNYWDGALVDYHLLLPYPSGRLVLYPHFNDFVTAGWLDKRLPWRRHARAHRWLTDVLLIAPSQQFLATLPNGKLPDRRDFYRYGLDHAAREAAWNRAIAECERFADDVMRWLERPDPSLLRPL